MGPREKVGPLARLRATDRDPNGQLRAEMGMLQRTSPRASEILAQALDLAPEDRATVAGGLIGSLEGPPDPGTEQALSQEILRRVAELHSGAVSTVAWSEVRARATDARSSGCANSLSARQAH